MIVVLTYLMLDVQQLKVVFCMASAHIVLSVMKFPANQRYIELRLTI